MNAVANYQPEFVHVGFSSRQGHYGVDANGEQYQLTEAQYRRIRIGMPVEINQPQVEIITPDPDCPTCGGAGEWDGGWNDWTFCDCVARQSQNEDSEIVLDQSVYYGE